MTQVVPTLSSNFNSQDNSILPNSMMSDATNRVDIIASLPIELVSETLSYLNGPDIANLLVSSHKIKDKADVFKAAKPVLERILELSKNFIETYKNGEDTMLSQVMAELQQIEIKTVGQLRLLQELERVLKDYTKGKLDKPETFNQFKAFKASVLAFDGKIQEALAEINSFEPLGVEVIQNISQRSEAPPVVTTDHIDRDVQFKNLVFTGFLPIIAKHDHDLAFRLLNDIKDELLKNITAQKICSTLAISNSDKALEKAEELGNLRDETIKDICMRIAKKDIDLSIQIINEKLNSESFHYLDFFMKTIKMLIIDLNKEPKEVMYFINDLLESNSPINADKKDLLLKDASDVLAKLDPKKALEYASEIESSFKKTSALKNIIEALVEKSDITGAIRIATQAERDIDKDVLLKFICECMDKKEMNKEEISKVVGLISNDRMKNSLISDLWLNL